MHIGNVIAQGDYSSGWSDCAPVWHPVSDNKGRVQGFVQSEGLTIRRLRAQLVDDWDIDVVEFFEWLASADWIRESFRSVPRTDIVVHLQHFLGKFGTLRINGYPPGPINPLGDLQDLWLGSRLALSPNTDAVEVTVELLKMVREDEWQAAENYAHDSWSDADDSVVARCWLSSHVRITAIPAEPTSVAGVSTLGGRFENAIDFIWGVIAQAGGVLSFGSPVPGLYRCASEDCATLFVADRHRSHQRAEHYCSSKCREREKTRRRRSREATSKAARNTHDALKTSEF